MSKRLEVFDKMIAAGSRDPFVWYARAMELRSLERLGEALTAYGDVEREFPDYVPTYLMAGQVAAAMGQVDLARGFFERGIVAATKAGDMHARSELSGALSTL